MAAFIQNFNLLIKAECLLDVRKLSNSDAYTHSDLPHYEVNMGKHVFYSMKKIVIEIHSRICVE